MQLLRAWNSGFTTSHGVPSPNPKHDMDAYMTTFLGDEF